MALARISKLFRIISGSTDSHSAVLYNSMSILFSLINCNEISTLLLLKISSGFK